MGTSVTRCSLFLKTHIWCIFWLGTLATLSSSPERKSREGCTVAFQLDVSQKRKRKKKLCTYQNKQATERAKKKKIKSPPLRKNTKMIFGFAKKKKKTGGTVNQSVTEAFNKQLSEKVGKSHREHKSETRLADHFPSFGCDGACDWLFPSHQSLHC